MVGDSGKVILAGLLEISYGAEGPMLDLNIIFETIGHVCPLIESDVCGDIWRNCVTCKGPGRRGRIECMCLGEVGRHGGTSLKV